MKDKEIVSTGFESAFIKTWKDWDDIDFLVVGFYNPKFTKDFSEEIGFTECDFVVLDLEKMIIEGYHCDEPESAEDTVIFSRKIKMGLA